jgi:PiT family inorganic phosphate transporter
MTSVLLVLIIAIALFFVFINGFHDTANVVATTISTRALSPYQAIIIAAIFNFIGAFFGT